MIPLAVPNISGNEGPYLEECVKSTFVSSVGPFVNRFEETVAAGVGSEKSVATSSGTTGLHAALIGVGVGRDDLVVLPSLTFIASANAISYCGAEPWLFDVDAESWTLSPKLFEEKMAEETVRRDGGVFHKTTGRRVAAVMPVYTLGLPADMDAIGQVARFYGLPVVADAAAAIGARYRGRNLSGLADLSVLSFNGNKTVTAGGGGAIVGTDLKLLELIRHLTTTARVGADYHHDRMGFNYRMTNLQAAVGCAQMERLGEFVEKKRMIRRTYDAAFAGRAGIGRFPSPDWAEGACWFSGVVLRDKSADEVRQIREKLRGLGVDARPFWKPMHLQPPYERCPRSTVEVSEGLWEKILTLPCSTDITDEELSIVIQAVDDVLGQG